MKKVAAALGAAFFLASAAEADTCLDSSAVIADAVDGGGLTVRDDLVGADAEAFFARLAAVAPPPRPVQPGEILVFAGTARPEALLVVLFEDGCTVLSAVLPRALVVPLLGEAGA